MDHTFEYRKKYSVSFFYPAAALIGLAVIVYMTGWGFNLKNFKLLVYPNSLYLCVLLALVFVAYGLSKVRKATSSSANPHFIVISDSAVSFPKGSQGQVEVAFGEVTRIYVSNLRSDNSLILYSESGIHEFEESNFESTEEFKRFAKILTSKVEA